MNVITESDNVLKGIDSVSTVKHIEFVKKPVFDVMKRIGDVLCSLLALIVLSPVFIVVSLIIVIDDFGNPFFAQRRVGKDGKVFKMLKFRSMYMDAEKRRNDYLKENEADGPLFKIKNDPRITKVGAFIRKTSIDELPQLINILKGDMSIIGPRPFVTYEQENFTEYQNKRHLIKPGLSCYAALDSTSHDDFDKWIEYDLKYLKERSVLTDIKIIFATVGVVLGRKNK